MTVLMVFLATTLTSVWAQEQTKNGPPVFTAQEALTFALATDITVTSDGDIKGLGCQSAPGTGAILALQHRLLAEQIRDFLTGQRKNVFKKMFRVARAIAKRPYAQGGAEAVTNLEINTYALALIFKVADHLHFQNRPINDMTCEDLEAMAGANPLACLYIRTDMQGESLSKHEKRLVDLEKETGLISQLIGALSKRLEKTENTLAQVESRVGNAETLLQQHTTQISQAASLALTALNKAVKNEKLAELRVQQTALEKNIGQDTKAYADWKEKAIALRQNYRDSRSFYRMDLGKKVTALNFLLADLQKKIEKAQNDLATVDRQISDLLHF